MAKTLLAFGTLFLVAVTVLASVATAGSSSRNGYGGARGYGGPLGVGPTFGAPSKSYAPSRTYRPKRSTKKRTYTRSKRRKSSSDKKIDTAKTAPDEARPDRENSTISAASGERTEPVVDNAAETNAKLEDEPTTTRKVACKKFFPSVGMTLTVACEEDR